MDADLLAVHQGRVLQSFFALPSVCRLFLFIRLAPNSVSSNGSPCYFRYLCLVNIANLAIVSKFLLNMILSKHASLYLIHDLRRIYK